MTAQDHIIGEVVAELVKRRLSYAPPGDDGPAAGAVVVSTFGAAEVCQLVEALRGFVAPSQGDPIKIVVATRDVGPIPEWARLEPFRSLTWYRNHNTTGLVLVELDEMSDKQGLGQMFRLTDQSVLAPGEDLDGTLDLLTKVAWQVADSQHVIADPPRALTDGLRRVFHGVSAAAPIPLRRWAGYAAECCGAVAGLGQAVSSAEVASVFGERLPELALFPHRALFDDRLRVERHLARNVALADLRNPQGKPVPEDFLERRIDVVELRDASGALSAEEQARIRELMRHFAEHVDDESRRGIDFEHWSLLFDAGSSRSGLGARVREALRGRPERLAEFEDLELEAALDENDQEAASLLIDAEPGNDDEPLVELLPPRLRRRIEKLAVPVSSTEDDPLRALLQQLVGFEDGEAEVRLTVDPSPEPSGEWTRALFVFLYGQTLRDLSDDAEAFSSRLHVNVALTTLDWPEPSDRDEEDGESSADEEDPWAPLHLALWTGNETSPSFRLRWRPESIAGFAAMVRLAAGRAGTQFPLHAQDLEGWTKDQQAALVLHGVGERPEPELSGWSGERQRHLRQWIREGVSIDGLTSYVDAWQAELARARADLVPQDAPMPGLDRLLDHDMLMLGSDRLVMLPTHALRARWFASHLQQLRADLSAALDARFHLNPENDNLYFATVKAASPHRQPPFVTSGSRWIGLAVREHALHEEYAAVAGVAHTKATDGVTDDASIDAIASTITSYLDAFPHKGDGLSLLLLSRDGDARLAHRLVRQVVRASGRHLAVELHVIAPLATHRAIAKTFEEAADDMEREQRLLPATQIVLHDWDEATGPGELDGLDERVDIAIVPNLFGTHTRVQEQTRPSDTGPGGRFRPWFDDSSHTNTVQGASENVSRVLLPRAPDPLSEHWSTLNVRRYRAAPVAPESPENIDYLTIQVTFDRNRHLFRRLHEVAHWVVTLDPFVGRDQIDSMESPPDVILVKTGVGKNKTYTMVVSSTAGRNFVIRGLDRKLRHNLGLIDPVKRSMTAERLYEVGRNTVPGVMLRALGLGRATEEIVGLVLTRFAVEEVYRLPTEDKAIEWWFSLDDRTQWFGGAHHPRADLIRVVFAIIDDRLRVSVRIIESKYRRTEDLGAADRQITRTVDLLKAGLSPSVGSADANDLDLWRRELLNALDETSKRKGADADLPALRYLGGADTTTLELARSLLLGGDYELEVAGVVCAIATQAEAPGGVTSTAAGRPLIRLNRPDIQRLLGRLERREPPATGPATFEVDPTGAAAEAKRVDADKDLEGTLVVARSAGDVVATDGADDRGSQGRGLGRDVLESRYQVLLDAFGEFKIDVSPFDDERYDEGPAFYLLRVAPGNGVAAEKLINRTNDLKLRLALPAEMHLRAYLDRGAVVFEVPKQDGERYDIRAQEIWQRASWPEGRLYVPVGADIAGDVVGLDFSSAETPHLLIAGTTGSGKSVALDAILQGLLRRHDPAALRLHLVDPKGTELAQFEDDPHVHGPVGIDAEDAIGTLELAVAEMQRRYAAMKRLRVRSLPDHNAAAADEADRLPWWLIVLDEYADLTSDPDEKKQVEALLKRLAQKARAAGIHLIIATQRPSADVISPVVRSNMPAQLALRVRTAVDSRVILDEAGAEALAGRGDAFLRTHVGLRRIQCAYVGE